MNKAYSNLRRRSCLVACLLAVVASAPNTFAAVTWHDVQFGGFVSQGFLANTGVNDYLGETSNGTADFREYAANASYAIGKWRLGAQIFGQELGEYGNDKLKLDWAIVDYQATQWIGFRAGRVKMPRGLYNEALDLDSIRPFVLLPQSVYDARLRDFNAAFNGGMIYGNVGAGKLGSIDYRAFYGKMPMSITSGANDYFNGAFNATSLAIGMDHVLGATVFWNLPIAGLRAGYSYSSFRDLQTTRQMMLAGRGFSYTKTADNFQRHLLSLEYSRGDWLFAAEAGREECDYVLVGFGSPLYNSGRQDYWYVSASRRINRWLELGTYVSHSMDHYSSMPPVPPPLVQTDYALSAKFDVTDRLIFKLEGHYMDGAGKIFDIPAHPQPLAKRDQEWCMIAAKLTFSF